jgi:hypothetical protein
MSEHQVIELIGLVSISWMGLKLFAAEGCEAVKIVITSYYDVQEFLRQKRNQEGQK